MSTTSTAIFAVVLAAGSARRFGSTKQLAETGGETLVHRAATLAQTACGDRSLLVVGHDAAAVTAAAAGQCAYLAVNERYERGLGTSLALAARVLSDSADALLLLLADQPTITAGHLDALMAAWNGDDRTIVATAYAGTVGVPALLPRATFARLATLGGDRGARVLFNDPDLVIVSVPFEGAAIDVDTPADLAAADP